MENFPKDRGWAWLTVVGKCGPSSPKYKAYYRTFALGFLTVNVKGNVYGFLFSALLFALSAGFTLCSIILQRKILSVQPVFDNTSL